MLSRRDFIQKMAAASMLPAALPVFQAPAKKLNIALIGLGQYGTLVAKALERSVHWNLVGLVSGSPEKAKVWKEKYNIADKNIYNYQNFDEIKNNPDIDAVYVILPNSMHKEFTLRAARAGKHVICEKPMANTPQDCQIMIDACKKAGVQLGIGYRLHFEPFTKEIMRFRDEKTFGQIRYIDASFGFGIGDPTQWRLKKKFAGGGPLMDVGIYCVQACRYATGEEPIAVSAQFGPVTDKERFKEVEESISWQLEFPSGVVTTSYSSYKVYLEHLRIRAVKGSVDLSPAFSYGPLKGTTSNGPMEALVDNHQWFQMEGMGKDLIETGKFPDHCSGQEGLRDMKILAKIYESARLGGKKLRLS